MMPALFLGFLAVFAGAFGGRGQVLLAHLAGRGGAAGHYGLLATGLSAAVLTALLAGYAGALVDALPARARTLLVALTLVLAGAEMLRPVRLALPAEPTRSLGAILLALGWHNATDGARLVLFALAAATGAPAAAAAGGALGGMAAAALGWAGGTAFAADRRLRGARVAIGAAFLVAASVVGLAAFGLLR